MRRLIPIEQKRRAKTGEDAHVFRIELNIMAAESPALALPAGQGFGAQAFSFATLVIALNAGDNAAAQLLLPAGKSLPDIVQIR